jgi:hypothetical protein
VSIKTLTFTAVGILAAFSAIGVGAYYGMEAILGRLIIQFPRGSRIANSPIAASGGSMTFRAVAGWVCNDSGGNLHTWCTSHDMVSISTVDWDNLLAQSASEPLGQTGLSTPWKLDIFARPLTSTAEVRMCTTSTLPSTTTAPTCDFDSAPNTTYGSNQSYLAIMIEGSSPQGGTLGLYNGVYDPTDPTDKAIHSVQYYDSGCAIHNPAKNATIPPCEHPGIVQVYFNHMATYSYKCQHGNCQISVYQ